MSASRSWAELSRENERLAMPSDRLAMPSDRLAARNAGPAPEMGRGEARSAETTLVPAGTVTSRQAPS
jgi:hypothetical protein